MSIFQDSMAQLVSADLNDVLKALNDIRERIEIVHIPESASFFSILFPEMLHLFTSRLHCQFSDTIENKCRSLILDILYRLPAVDQLRQSATTIELLAISVIANDNEDNALIAVKIIPNLHKAFKQSLSDCVQPFLDVVCDIFRQMTQESLTKLYFSQPVIEIDQGDKADEFSSQTHHSFIPSKHSFKVASELPNIIMLLLQLHPQHMHSNIDRLIPTVVSSLTIADSDNNFNSPIFRDLITCRIKVINFMACILKGFFDKVKAFEKLIISSIVNLIRSCPADMLHSRRELLVATRHVLASDFRTGFISYLPQLLDEGWLVDGINCGPACCRKNNYLSTENRELLRPIAYEIIADTLNNNSNVLTVHQIGVEIYMLGRSLASLSSYINNTIVSIQLLSFLVEKLNSLSKTDAVPLESIAHSKRLLIYVLESIVNLLGNHDRILLLAQESDEMLTESLTSLGKGGLKNCLMQVSSLEDNMTDKDQEWVSSIKSLVSVPISSISFNRTVLSTSHGVIDPDTKKKYVKKLFRVITDCIDVYSRRLSRYQSDGVESKSNDQSQSSKRDLSYSDFEIMLLSKYFHLIIVFLRKIYIPPITDQDVAELRDLVDCISSSVSHHDSNVVRAIFHSNMEQLFQAISEYYAVFSLIPERMMLKYGHANVLIDVIVQYSIRKLPILSRPIDRATPKDAGSNKQLAVASVGLAATVLIKLIRLVFSALTSPACVARDVDVVGCRLQEIVLSCIRLAAESRYSVNYFLLLRTIFRSSALQKYEILQNKLLEILPDVIIGLYRLFLRTSHDAVSGLLMQLFFSIPLKMDRLMPYMPVLLRIVAKALRSRGELLENALRVFESWVDSPNSVAILDVMNSQPTLCADLMMAIMEHLKPFPYPLGGLAMKIIGKIGGRSRQALIDMSQGTWNHYSATSMLLTEQRSVNCDISDLASLVISMHIPVSSGQTVSLSFGPVIAASIELIDVLTLKSQVEAEVPSLMHSYPLPAQLPFGKFKKGASMEEVEATNVKPDFLTEYEIGIVMKDIKLPKKECLRTLLEKLKVKEPEISVATDNNFNSVQSEIKQIVSDTSLSTKQAAFNSICVAINLITKNERSELDGNSLLLLRCLLKGIIMSSSDDAFSQSSSEILLQVCQHCVDGGCQKDYCMIICSAVYDTMMDARPAVYVASFDAMKSIADFFLQIGEQACVFVDSAFRTAANTANADQWSSALGCIRMIGCLCESFSQSYIEKHECNLLMSLFQILKSCQTHFTTIACEDVFDSFRALLQACHSSSSLRHSLSPLIVSHDQEPFIMHRPRSMSITTDIFINGQSSDIKINRSGLYSSSACSPVDLPPTLSDCIRNLLKESFNPKTTVRLASKMSLKLIAKYLNCEVGSLIQPFVADYLDACVTSDYFMMETSNAVGTISGFAFLLQQKKSVIEVNDMVLQAIAKVLKLTLHYSDIPNDKFPGKRSLAKDPSKDDFHGLNEDYNLLISLFPGEIPISLQIRLCAIKCFQSLAVHGSNVFVNEKYSELRNGILSLLFRSIMETTWLEVMNNAQRAITQIVSVLRHCEPSMHGTILSNEFFQPFVQLSHDFSSLSISKMSCLSRVLQLTTVKSPQLTNVFIHHLRALFPPFSQVSHHAWPDGDEIVMARAVANIFHKISISPSDFHHLSKASDCVVEFPAVENVNRFGELPSSASTPKFTEIFQLLMAAEGAHYSFHSSPFSASPFIYPISRFLERNTLHAMELFQDVRTLSNEKYMRLIAIVLASGECPNLICTIASKESVAKITEVCMLGKQPRSTSRMLDWSVSSDPPSVPSLSERQTSSSSRQTSSQLLSLSSSKSEMFRYMTELLNVDYALGVISSQNGALAMFECLFEISNSGFNIINILPLLRIQWSLLLREKSWASPYFVANSESESVDNSMEELHHLFDKQILMVARLLINCVKVGCRDAEIVMDLCHCLIFCLSSDLSLVRNFLRVEICKIVSLSDRIGMISRIVNALTQIEMSVDVKVCCIREALIPLLISSFQEDSEIAPIMDPELVRNIVGGIICKPTTISNNALHIELLKLSATITRYKYKDLWGVRKELIRFAWDHLKFEDSHVKMWAYIAVCQFTSKFEIPSKLIFRLFVLLLRSYHVDQRDHANCALDILIPAFSERIQDSRDFVRTMRSSKKVVYEEGNSLMQLSHAWSAVVRHASIFYGTRHYFVPHMINSMSKIGLQQSVSLENKILSVGIADCIISWEVLRQARLRLISSSHEATLIVAGEESKTEHGTISNTAQNSNMPPSFPAVLLFDDSYVPNPAQIEILCSFLTHLAVLTVENKDPSFKRLSSECVTLYYRVFSIFDTRELKLNFLGNCLKSVLPGTSFIGMSSNEAESHSLSPELTSLFLQLIEISVVSQRKLAEFANIHGVLLKPLLLRAVNVVSRQTQKYLQLFIHSLVKMYPPAMLNDVSPSINAVYQTLKGGVEKCLHSVTKKLIEIQNSNAKVNPSDSSAEPDNVRQLGLQAVLLIKIICHYDLNFVSNHGVSLLHLAQRISSHHWSSLPSRNAGSNEKGDSITYNRIAAVSSMVLLSESYNGGPISVPKPDEYLEILQVCICLLGNAFSASLLLDYRKPILQLIGDNLDFSDCVPILVNIVEIASDWILSPIAPLSSQEKVSLFSRMYNFDRIIPESTAQPLLYRTEELFEKLSRKSNDSGFFWLKDSVIQQKTDFSALLSCHSKIRGLALERLVDGLNEMKISKKIQHLLQRLLEFGSSSLVGRMWLLLFPLGIFSGCFTSCFESFLQTSETKQKFFIDDGFVQNVLTLSRGRLDVIEFLVALVLRLFVKVLDTANWELAFTKLLSRCCDQNQRAIVTIPSSLYYLGCTSNAESVNVPQRLLNILFNIDYAELENFLLKTIDAISFVASKFGVWGNLVDFLQSRLSYNRSFEITSFSHQSHVIINLRALLQDAGWRNMELGLCSLISQRQQTKMIVSRSQYYLDSDSFGLCTSSMKSEMDKSTQETGWVDKFEFSLWERTWVDSAKRLGEWDVLQEFGKKTHRSLIVADASSTLSDLQTLDALRSCSSLLAEQEIGVSSRKFIEAQLLAMQGKQSEIEKISQTCSQLALQKWQVCPPIVAAGESRCNLLVLFQRIVEFKESISLILDVTRPSEVKPSLPAQIIGIWKSRVPCFWEEIPIWESLLSWRNCTFQSLTEEQKSDHLVDCAFQTNLALSKAAREAEVFQTSLTYLDRINKSDFNVPSALMHEYQKERLSSLINLHNKKDEASQIIDNAIASHASDSFKSDLYLFKAKLALSTNCSSDANAYFSQSVQVNQANYNAWSAWGQYCDQTLRRETTSIADMKQFMSMATLVAIMRSLSLNAKSASIFASRCISLMTEDDEKLSNSLVKLFNQYYAEIEPFVWIPFLDFIIFSPLFQSERAFVNLCVSVSKAHPFLVFQSIRRHQLSCYGDRATFSLSGARKSIDDKIISSIMHQSFCSWSCVLRTLSFHEEIDRLHDLAPVDVVHYSKLVSLFRWLLKSVEDKKKKSFVEGFEEKEASDDVRGKRKRTQSEAAKVQSMSLQLDSQVPDVLSQKIWSEISEFSSAVSSNTQIAVLVSDRQVLLSSLRSFFGNENVNVFVDISLLECLRILERWTSCLRRCMVQFSFTSIAESPDHCSTKELSVSLQSISSSLADIVGDSCSFIGLMASDACQSMSTLSPPYTSISLPDDVSTSFRSVSDISEKLLSVHSHIRFVIDPACVYAIIGFKSSAGHLRRYRLTFSTWSMDSILGGDVSSDEQPIKRTRMSSATSSFLLPCFMHDWSNSYLHTILLMLLNDSARKNIVCQREHVAFNVPRICKPSYHGLLVECNRLFPKYSQYSVEHILDDNTSPKGAINSQLTLLLEAGSSVEVCLDDNSLLDEIRKYCRHSEDFWIRKRFFSQSFAQTSFLLMAFNADISSTKNRSMLVDVSSGFVFCKDFSISIPSSDSDITSDLVSRNGLSSAVKVAISPLLMKGTVIPTIGICAIASVANADSVHAVLELVLHLVRQEKLHDNVSCTSMAGTILTRLKWLSPYEYRNSLEEADDHIVQALNV